MRNTSLNKHIPALDGVRGVAISLVVISHVFPPESRYREIGHMGVLLFFALSGYLITTKLLDEYREHEEIRLRAFYLRRAFRILPAALTYLLILSILIALNWVNCDQRSIMAAALFYVNYIPVSLVAWKAGHFWSLSVEEHFYLLWPALLLLFGVLRGWRTAAFLACSICLWRCVYQDWRWWFHTDYIADALFGAAAWPLFPRGKSACPRSRYWPYAAPPSGWWNWDPMREIPEHACV